MADNADQENNRLLSVIRDAIEKSHRCIQDADLNKDRVLLQIRRSTDALNVLTNLNRLDLNCKQDIESTLTTLEEELRNRIARDKQSVRFEVQQIKTGRRGRPQFNLPVEHLQMFHDFGYSAQKMAQHFGCSASLVYRRLYEEGIFQRDKFHALSDQQLDAKVEGIHCHHLNTGSVR